MFTAACLLYLSAAREWLVLEGREATGGTSDAGWDAYNRYTLAGAVLFVLEPSLDFAGAWSAAVLFTLEQARWEWDTTSRSTSGDQEEGQLERAPPAQRSTCWTGRWIWTGYTVWDDEQTVPTMASLMRSDLNFWAAVFFLVASGFYLYQSAVPYLYDDYCRCSDQRHGCGLSMGPEPSSSMSGATAIHTVGYCVAGWLAALMFVLDAAIGLAAWYANRYRMQLLLGRVRTMDWLGLSAGLFMLGAVLEVVDCAVENAGLNFVAQLCWLLNGFAYLVDAYDTRELSRQICVPLMPPSRGQTCGSHQLSDIRWVPL